MVVGITGGIGSGKTTICKILSVMGYNLYNCDMWASFLMNNDVQLINQIKDIFSEKAYKNNSLDREYLASKVFCDSKELKKLESIVHPALFKHLENYITLYPNEITFIESAILFESGLDKIMDKTITVSAPENLRIKRVIKRDKASPEKVKERMNKQMSDAERENLADYILICDDENSVIMPLLKLLDEFA